MAPPGFCIAAPGSIYISEKVKKSEKLFFEKLKNSKIEMLKNAKICPAILGTEELVAYLHTLLQENSHNMRSLWVNDANEATLPVRFQQEKRPRQKPI